jgi:hypothetical protein
MGKWTEKTLFPKKDRWPINTWKKCSLSLAISEIQIKATLRGTSPLSEWPSAYYKNHIIKLTIWNTVATLKWSFLLHSQNEIPRDLLSGCFKNVWAKDLWLSRTHKALTLNFWLAIQCSAGLSCHFKCKINFYTHRGNNNGNTNIYEHGILNVSESNFRFLTIF